MATTWFCCRRYLAVLLLAVIHRGKWIFLLKYFVNLGSQNRSNSWCRPCSPSGFRENLPCFGVTWGQKTSELTIHWRPEVGLQQDEFEWCPCGPKCSKPARHGSSHRLLYPKQRTFQGSIGFFLMKRNILWWFYDKIFLSLEDMRDDWTISKFPLLVETYSGLKATL